MQGQRAGLFRHEVVPFYLYLVGLFTAAILCDALLHLLDKVWIGRYLGIPGVLLILLSFGHALRKRGWITHGSPIRLLRWHERLAWAGSLLILVHAGIHFNAWLPWLAIAAMVLNVCSGLTGKFLVRRAARRLEATRQAMQAEGLDRTAQDEQLHLDSLMFETVKRWRIVHFPITIAFALLALAHILSIFLFWEWR